MILKSQSIYDLVNYFWFIDSNNHWNLNCFPKAIKWKWVLFTYKTSCSGGFLAKEIVLYCTILGHKKIVTENFKDLEQKALQKVEVYKWILVYENVSKYNLK